MARAIHGLVRAGQSDAELLLHFAVVSEGVVNQLDLTGCAI